MTGQGREREEKHATILPVMVAQGLLSSTSSQSSADSTSSPTSSSTGLGTKRISQPDSPQVSAVEQAPKDERVGSLVLTAATATKCLTEEEWARSSNFASIVVPPYPLTLVSRVFRIVGKIVNYFHVYFLRRESPLPDNLTESRFRRKNIPSISLEDYLQRICNYVVALEPSVLLAVLAYAHILDPPMDDDTFPCHRNNIQCGQDERAGELEPRRQPILRIDLFAVHRFLITGITLASKALGDHYYSNAFYAKVGGVSTKELNYLELDLAMMLDWQLQVSRDTLQSIWSQLDCLEY